MTTSRALFLLALAAAAATACDTLKIPRDKVYSNLDRYGNTSAGSIPLAVDEAIAEGKLKAGDTTVLSGFGAGLTWGTAVMRW